MRQKIVLAISSVASSYIAFLDKKMNQCINKEVVVNKMSLLLPDTYETLGFPTTWQYYLIACKVLDHFFTPYFKNHQYQRNDNATKQNQEYSSHVIQVETFCVPSF